VTARLDAPHRIELDAASDNNPAAEPQLGEPEPEPEGGDHGRWATPAQSEMLPLAPWY
jgi:hypothetical protein